MNADHILLVVEDDVVAMTMVASSLERRGYQVRRATTIAEALQSIRAVIPSLIVLDLTVQDPDPFSSLTDGFALLRLLRRTNPKADMPVIIHTADNSPRVQTTASSLGAAGVVVKGGPPDALLQSIQTALDAAKTAPPKRPQEVAPLPTA
jgi:CheY-like chemotaxis protein